MDGTGINANAKQDPYHGWLPRGAQAVASDSDVKLITTRSFKGSINILTLAEGSPVTSCGGATEQVDRLPVGPIPLIMQPAQNHHSE